MENKRKLGTKYELLAAAYLQEKGYRILEHNYRNRFGEIDLIALDGTMDEKGCVVYVEIKYRANAQYGDALEAVDVRKQKRISKVALYHYTKFGSERGMQCRFDVIAIYGDGRIRHIENAFPYGGF